LGTYLRGEEKMFRQQKACVVVIGLGLAFISYAYATAENYPTPDIEQYYKRYGGGVINTDKGMIAGDVE
jgi:predicted secreted Zn-dependent protease